MVAAVSIITGIFQVISYVLSFYLIILFAAFVFRLVKADENNPIIRTILILTEPPARWLSRKFPALTMISNGQILDLSPMVLMLGVACLQVFLPYLRTAIVSIFV